MADVATFAYLPLISLILGALAGFVAGRWISTKGLLWLIGRPRSPFWCWS